MKRSVLLLLTGTFALFSFGFGEVCQEINSALKAGNYKQIAAFFNGQVELNIPGNEGLYSKPQAEALLKDFFAKNPVKNYTSKHGGDSKDGSKFVIGMLECSTGTYRTYYFVKKFDSGFLIKEFRIEKE